jgi:hypothetical protein
MAKTSKSGKSGARNRKQVLLVASGDLRLSANQTCWPEQEKVEAALSQAVREAG